LTPQDVDYLRDLPLTIEKDDFTLAHGSPREPIWEYLLSVSSARENFVHFNTKFCLVGHSHVPLIFKQTETSGCSFSPFQAGDRLVLAENRLIINPGGVGQPRDGDPRASYAIYDSDNRVIQLYRIPYNIGVTQSRMMQHKLPLRLIVRLSYGM